MRKVVAPGGQLDEQKTEVESKPGQKALSTQATGYVTFVQGIDVEIDTAFIKGIEDGVASVDEPEGLLGLRWEVWGHDDQPRPGARCQGDLDNAIADYDAAIRLEPKSAKALAFRSDAYMKKGNKELAEEDLAPESWDGTPE